MDTAESKLHNKTVREAARRNVLIIDDYHWKN